MYYYTIYNDLLFVYIYRSKRAQANDFMFINEYRTERSKYKLY